MKSILAFVSLMVVLAVGSKWHIDDEDVDFFRAADSASTKAPTCVPVKPCLTNAECGGTGQGSGRPGQPRCVGALVGICDCTACVGGLPCKDDSRCGGLIGACSNKTRTCNCLQAAQMHYNEAKPSERPPTLGASIAQFCNKENCMNSTVGCYGLPCKKGFCICT